VISARLRTLRTHPAQDDVNREVEQYLAVAAQTAQL
jgi:hypothetical protein